MTKQNTHNRKQSLSWNIIFWVCHKLESEQLTRGMKLAVTETCISVYSGHTVVSGEAVTSFLGEVASHVMCLLILSFGCSFFFFFLFLKVLCLQSHRNRTQVLQVSLSFSRRRHRRFG